MYFEKERKSLNGKRLDQCMIWGQNYFFSSNFVIFLSDSLICFISSSILFVSFFSSTSLKPLAAKTRDWKKIIQIKKSISLSWADTMLTKKWTVFKSIFKWRNISIISPWWLPCRFPEPESQRSVEHWTPPFPQGLFGQTPWFMINFHGDDGFGDNYHDDDDDDDDDTYSRGMDQGPSHQGKSLFHPSITTIGAWSYFVTESYTVLSSEQ